MHSPTHVHEHVSEPPVGRPGGRPRVVAVVQARAGSHRLPGKVLRPLAGRPVLEWVVRAAREAGGVDDVVVATSDAPGDDQVAALGSSLGVDVVRGSEDDVLSRFLLARDATDADAVVRLTADCPLLDPALIGLVAAAWRAAPDLEYVATTLVRTLPRGMDVELASRPALERADRHASGHHRVHVTSWLYTEPGRCRTLGLVVTPDNHDLRVTLDTAADAELIEAVVRELGDAAPAWRDVVGLLRRRPDLTALVQDVRQKRLEDG